jgi:carboxyl-terminal processing protease
MNPVFPVLVVTVAASLAMNHRAARAASAPGLRSEIGGVGLALERKEGRYLVHGLVEGSPAARSRMIEVGDELIALRTPPRREVAVKGLEFEIVVDLIRGEPGETIELKLRRERQTAPSRVTLVRERLEIEE